MKTKHYDQPLSFISLTPAATQPPAKVAKVKAAKPAGQTGAGTGRSCQELGVCNAKGCGDCVSCAAASAAITGGAAGTVQEDWYLRGYTDFEAGLSFAQNPFFGAGGDKSARWYWDQGWLDAQADHGHPPTPAPDHRQLARQELAKAFLFALAAAVLTAGMLWHSIRADARVATHAVAQVQESAR